MTKDNKAVSRIICIAMVIFLVFMDQFTKTLAVKYLMGKESIVLIPNVLELLYIENTGIAFSLLKNQMAFLYVITLVVSFFIIVFMHKLPNTKRFRIAYFLLGVLLAGAMGNLIDRLMNHYVVDFIYFSLIDFPVFNVADIYVTVSVFVLAFLFIFFYQEEELSLIFEKKGK